jgi:hypothetical protein
VTRLRASTHIERAALTLVSLAAFYAIWLGIGLPGLLPGPAGAANTPAGSVVEAQLGARSRPVQQPGRRPAVPPARVRTRLVSGISHDAAGPSARAAAPAAPAPAVAPAPSQPDRQPAATAPPAAPPPPAPPATIAQPELPTPPTPPTTTTTADGVQTVGAAAQSTVDTADGVQTVGAAAQSTVDTAVGALPTVPDVSSVTSLVPSVSH